MECYHIEQLLQAGAAGILIFPGDHAVERREGHLVSAGDLERVETLARLQRQHVPFVLIDRYVPEIDCDCVVTDMQPTADLGRHAAHLLLGRIAGRSSAARRVVVPVSIVVRQSCGATPRRAPLAAPSLRA